MAPNGKKIKKTRLDRRRRAILRAKRHQDTDDYQNALLKYWLNEIDRTVDKEPINDSHKEKLEAQCDRIVLKLVAFASRPNRPETNDKNLDARIANIVYYQSGRNQIKSRNLQEKYDWNRFYHIQKALTISAAPK